MTASRRQLAFDGFSIDFEAGEVLRDGAAVPVEPQVFDLIALLARNPGRLIGQQEVIDKVWHGRIVSDSAIASRVNAARRALGDDGTAQRIIKTVRGRGFRFELRPSAAPFVLSCTPHGFSILMGTRGAAQEDDWRGALPGALETAATQCDGCVLAAHLATFASADAALNAAAALIAGVQGRCGDMSAERQWTVKVGIADSAESAEVACLRAGLLAAVAPPGGICATAAVASAVSGALEVQVERLPIETWYEPVDAVRVLALAGRGFTGGDASKRPQILQLAIPEPREVSVAVLPFEVMGGDEELQQTSIGLRLEIQNALTQLSGVLPIAAGTVAAFAGATSPEAARTLGVRYVLQGNLRARQREVRLMLELYDRTLGGVAWSRSYEGSLDEGFGFQDQMTAQVVKSLDVHILSGEQARIWHKSLGDSRVIRLQYQGMREFFRMTRESMRAARDAFETVHRLCPDVASGSTWAALCHWFDLQRGWSEDVAASRRAVEHWASIAIGMEDADGQAHTALCHVHMMNREYDKALDIGARATAICPSCANANGFYAYALYFCGVPDEAVYHARLAIRFSPVYPPLFGIVLSGALLAQGDHAGALAMAAELVRLGVRDPLARLIYCSALASSGRLAEAGHVATGVVGENREFHADSFLERLPFRRKDEPENLAERFAAARRNDIADGMATRA